MPNLIHQNPPIPNRLVQLMGVGLLLTIVLEVSLLVAGIPREVPLKSDGQPWVLNILSWSITFSQEQRMTLLVVLAGSLGSTLHAATSFAKYIGLRHFYRSWFWWYLLRPFIGAMAALVFYFAVRGGIIVNTNGTAGLSVYGVLAFSAIAGLFSKQAIERLGAVFTRFFNYSDDGEVLEKDKPVP